MRTRWSTAGGKCSHCAGSEPVWKRQRVHHRISGSWHLTLLSLTKLKRCLLWLSVCGQLVGVDVMAALDMYAERGQWDKCLDTASKQVLDTTISLTLLDKLSIWINGANLSCNNSSVISCFQLLKCEYFLVSFLLYDRKLNIFGLWTKQDIWECRLFVTLLLQQTSNRFVEEATDRLSDNENNH